MPRKRLPFAFLFLVLFCGAALDLHSEGEEHGQAAACNECCVSCCPSRHLGPGQDSPAPLPPGDLSGNAKPETADDPSVLVPHSIFHPPKAAFA